MICLCINFPISGQPLALRCKGGQAPGTLVRGRSRERSILSLVIVLARVIVIEILSIYLSSTPSRATLKGAGSVHSASDALGSGVLAQKVVLTVLFETFVYLISFP